MDQLIADIRLRCKYLTVTNALTYYREVTIIGPALLLKSHVWRHDTQHNGTQHNASFVMLIVIYGQYHKQTQYAECHYSECHYVECRQAECRGALRMWSTLEATHVANVRLEWNRLALTNTLTYHNEVNFNVSNS